MKGGFESLPEYSRPPCKNGEPLTHRKPYTTPIASALRHFFRGQDGTNNFSLARLWEQWDTLFGPDITGLISPLGHRGDTLLLGADDAIVIQEFTYFADQILERVNGFLGEPVFRHIHIELLRGRSPLNRNLLPTSFSGPVPIKPDNLGNPRTLPDDDSPVSRAYRSYVRFFQQSTDKGESEQADQPISPTPTNNT
jgi:hypothetical protein